MKHMIGPLLVWGLPLLAAPTLKLSPAIPCVFAGRETKRVLEFGEATSGTVSWRVEVVPTHRRLLQREQRVERTHQTAISIAVPPLRNGAMMAVEVNCLLTRDTGATHEIKEQFWAFPLDAFSAADQAWSRQGLYLLDPDGGLAGIVKDSRLEPQSVKGVEGLLAKNEGVLLVGPGARLDKSRLIEQLAELASRGWRVVVLAPAAGHVELVPSERFSLTTASSVRKLDKRLDPAFGRPQDGFALSTRGGQVVLEAGVASAPSCWAEFEYESGGALVITALPIIGAWDDGPTPRYLLRSMLLTPRPRTATEL